MSARQPAPFRVYRRGGDWLVQPRHGALRGAAWAVTTVAGFATQAEAIDYVYRNWPWWP